MTNNDDGTITVLVVGFTGILLTLIAVIVDVSAVVLARRAAASAADGAAIAAAQQLDRDVLYARGLDRAIPLSPTEVGLVVSQYEQDAQQGQPGLVLDPFVDADGTTATVEARREITLPFAGWLGRTSVTVTAVARARSPLAAP